MKLAPALLLLASACFSQQPADRVPLRDRMWISSKIYSAILQYFGHWQAVPDLDLDAAYKKYLDRIAPSDDRMEFDLATMEFMACLCNGHSDFGDPWAWDHAGRPLGFWLDRIDGKWVVRDAQIEGLEPGQAVTAIDGQPVEQVVAGRMKYIAASDDRARRFKAFSNSFLWPDTFTLTLEGGRQLTVDRRHPKPHAARPQSPRLSLPQGVAYHRIPSFDDPKFENAAIEFVKAHAGAKLLIFDVRNNGGGSSPERLLRAVMDRPYRDWMQASAMSFGLFAAYGSIFRNLLPKDADPRERGYLEGFSEYFERPYFMTPGSVKLPESPIYTGPIYVLQDRFCGSACEDFVMPLKTSRRATLFGERTFGSSGQPYMMTFDNRMTFRVSTKRMYLPDGSEFEGVGIRPDVEITPPPAATEDLILKAALDAFARH